MCAGFRRQLDRLPRWSTCAVRLSALKERRKLDRFYTRAVKGGRLCVCEKLGRASIKILTLPVKN
jgi:hypothetical protein